MYDNNENNKSSYEYHYRYRPSYDEPLPTPEPSQPAKSPKHGTWKRVVAGVLCAALLIGGSFGAGWAVKGWRASQEEAEQNETQILVSDREHPEVETVSVTGAQEMTFSQVYQANVGSCVSINVASVDYNIFWQPVQTASSGSGFVITDDGYIVTNYHVVNGGTDVQVTLHDGTTYPAEIIGGDEDYDIAVIKVDPGETKLQTVVLGSSEGLLVGEEILAIGNPLGELTFSMSEGIVSCVDREINVDGTPFNMIQITAAVNSGNSGGPLFNTYGEVVGIVSAKYSTSSSGASVEGLGFAIPIDDVLSMIKDIMENGRVTTRPYMGVSVADVSRYPETGVQAGAYLAEVVEGSPADQAGLQVGDVITMIGSTLISGQTDITDAVGSKSYQAGDTVTITYLRAGQVYTTELTFGSDVALQTEQAADAAQTPQQGQVPQQDDSYQGGYYPYYGYGGSMDDFFDQFFGRP